MSGIDPDETRRRLTDQDRVRITLARFEGLATKGAPTPLSVLAKRFGRDKAVISRIISSALRSGLVTIRANAESLTEPVRLRSTERELIRKYPSLIDSIVIDTPDPPDYATPEGLLSYSDDIHRLLGYALARELCNGTMIREGDRLGIGPGRGVYETVRAMQRQKSIRARSVTLVSLSGVGYLRHHSNNRNLLLDSDFIISFMGEAFDFPVTLDVVAAPLVAPAFESASIFNSWLTLPDRTRPTLNTAILGVGSFAGGNRFFEEASASVATQQPAYEAIRPALRALRVATSKLPVGEYVPVADVGYHLFFAPSPQRKSSLPESVEADIQRQLEAINRLLLSAHKNHFKSMQSVMLVAGTRGKASALHHLLSSSWIRVTHVTTDRATAHALLTF